MSPDGKQFSVTSPDRRIRVFWYRTGKLRRVYDESLEVGLELEKFSVNFKYWPVFSNDDSTFLIRWLKIYKEVTLLCIAWRPLILEDEWLSKSKLSKQRLHLNQMRSLMKAQIFSSMLHSLG